MRSYGDHVPRPEPDVSLEQWLRAALVAVHRMNAQHGRVYFELASGADFDGQLGDIARARRVARSELVHRFTDTAWDLAGGAGRSAEHTSELPSLMRISYAVFCLKQKKH